MNVFQAQLILNDGRTLAEHHNGSGTLRYPIELALVQQHVSVADFEADMRKMREANGKRRAAQP